VRGKDQPVLQRDFGFGLKEVVHLAHPRDIGDLEVVFAMLLLALQVHVSVAALLVPSQVAEVAHPLQRHSNTFQPISDLYRDRIEHHTASLLKIGKLGNLLPIQPHLPTQTPRAEGGRFPVILDETDIVLARVDPQGFKRAKV